MKVEDYIIVGQDTLSYQLINEPDLISPQDSVNISVRFTPAHPGTNEAVLQIRTNNPSDSLVTLILSGYGRGGLFSETTLVTLQSISDSSFETLTKNNKEIKLANTGDRVLQIQISFVENYFRLTNEE